MKNQYQKPVDIIGEGFEACWLNAIDLTESAKFLQNQGHYAIGLSLAVLAMEEIGKMILIDGLLFAKSDDERSKLYKKGFFLHKLKLRSLDVFPLMLNYISTLDPRYNSQPVFNLTLVAVIKQYQNERKKLEPWLGQSFNLEDLDQWKQNGFYANYSKKSGKIIRPVEIDEDFANAVIQLANRIVDAVNFILKDNITRYKKRIKTLRQKLPEEELLKIRKHAKELVDSMFTVNEH